MLIRKLGSNSSLPGTDGVQGSHGPASQPKKGSCIPRYCGVLHPTPLWAPASHPSLGSCIPPH